MLLCYEIVSVDIADRNQCTFWITPFISTHYTFANNDNNKKCVSIAIFIPINCNLHSGQEKKWIFFTLLSLRCSLLYGNRFKNWIMWQMKRNIFNTNFNRISWFLWAFDYYSSIDQIKIDGKCWISSNCVDNFGDNFRLQSTVCFVFLSSFRL